MSTLDAAQRAYANAGAQLDNAARMVREAEAYYDHAEQHWREAEAALAEAIAAHPADGPTS